MWAHYWAPQLGRTWTFRSFASWMNPARWSWSPSAPCFSTKHTFCFPCVHVSKNPNFLFTFVLFRCRIRLHQRIQFALSIWFRNVFSTKFAQISQFSRLSTRRLGFIAFGKVGDGEEGPRIEIRVSARSSSRFVGFWWGFTTVGLMFLVRGDGVGIESGFGGDTRRLYLVDEKKVRRGNEVGTCVRSPLRLGRRSL